MDRAREDLLVLAAQGGDSQAFDQLFRANDAPLRRFAYRLCGDQHIAVDAVQESWVTLSRTLRKLQDPRGFRLWAYKTTRWRTMDLLRRRPMKQETLDGEEATLAVETEEPLATSDQLSRHLAALPQKEKVALTLFYLEELSVMEIAAVEDVPVGTVKSRLSRARDRLRRRMTGDET
ncbi:RNA polymerase sigma factor [Kordiimonas lacus]|uniref:RNA polymerase sigma-70 factor, ECF subfamily n=1 Tax=Kordiimonas lacus TaxID=637679 RepID=A0A1G7B167_9PROT|nr:sigma-70 family RNA polymerase sigma factor [Kordiimonas lacus]SDE20597.1 RNA polymerase sigma-70 factor, ECF subfamily [Kordiimonas lacus]